MTAPDSQATEEQSRPPARFRRAEAPPGMLPCRFCGSPSELWQRWERDDVWFSFGCCTNLEDVDGEPCTFHLPDSVAFYLPRKVEAVRYWNLMMGPRPAGDVPAQPQPQPQTPTPAPFEHAIALACEDCGTVAWLPKVGREKEFVALKRADSWELYPHCRCPACAVKQGTRG